jgi:hypothetical protein
MEKLMFGDQDPKEYDNFLKDKGVGLHTSYPYLSQAFNFFFTIFSTNKPKGHFGKAVYAPPEIDMKNFIRQVTVD